MGKFGAVSAQCQHGDNIAIPAHGIQGGFDIVDIQIPERCRQNAGIDVGGLFDFFSQVVTQNRVTDVSEDNEQREGEQGNQRQRDKKQSAAKRLPL